MLFEQIDKWILNILSSVLNIFTKGMTKCLLLNNKQL